MTDEALKAFEDKVYAFVGREVCPPTPSEDDVNPAMIRHWAEAMGDTNPAYLDKDWAAKSTRGKTIAPPAMMYVWGHSYEFTNQNNWELMEDFCKLVGGRDDIWYATNIEIVD